MEKKFCEHLLEIGLIDSKTLSQIITLYNSQKETETNDHQFNKKMTGILLLFFDSLTEMQKKFICFHLPAKFIKLIKFKIKKHLTNIIHKIQLKNKLILMKYLFRWYRHKNNFNNIKDSNFDKELENKNILRQGSFKFNKANGLKKKIIYGTNNNIYNSIIEFIEKTNNLNSSNLPTKNETKENESKNNDINNKKTKKDKGTYDKKKFGNFNINLNKENINNFNNGQILVRNKENTKKMYINNNQISNLMQNYTLINQKIKNFDLINNEFIDSIETNENYISTNFNSANRYQNNKKNKNVANIVVRTKNSKINGSNFNLFNTSNTNQNCNNKKIINIKPRNNNNIYNLIYCNNYNNLNNNNYVENNMDLNLFTEKTPFCDKKIKTIESIRNPKTSPGKRLYEQGMKKLKNKKNMKNFSPEQIQNSSEKPKSVDYKHINSLYKNNKRSKTMDKVKSKVEKEEGLTFHPEINKDNYTDRINSNFLERNYSSPRNGKYMNEYTERIKSGHSSKNKKINKIEKEIIVKGMINRLYKNKNMDESGDNSLFCKKYLLKGMKTSNYLKGYKKKI